MSTLFILDFALRNFNEADLDVARMLYRDARERYATFETTQELVGYAPFADTRLNALPVIPDACVDRLLTASPEELARDTGLLAALGHPEPDVLEDLCWVAAHRTAVFETRTTRTATTRFDLVNPDDDVPDCIMGYSMHEGKLLGNLFALVDEDEHKIDVTVVEVMPGAHGQGACRALFTRLLTHCTQHYPALDVKLLNVGGLAGCRCYQGSAEKLGWRVTNTYTRAAITCDEDDMWMTLRPPAARPYKRRRND
jgi:hypothetical protein